MCALYQSPPLLDVELSPASKVACHNFSALIFYTSYDAKLFPDCLMTKPQLYFLYRIIADWLLSPLPIAAPWRHYFRFDGAS